MIQVFSNLPERRATDPGADVTDEQMPTGRGRSDDHSAPRPSMDDLEIALRKLPGVRSVGFVSGSDITMVQLHIDGGKAANIVPMQAARLAYRYSHGSVAVEVIRWRGEAPATDGVPKIAKRPERVAGTPASEEMRWIEPRVIIDKVSVSDDGLDVEVVLSFGAQQVTRRSNISTGLVGVSAATLDALREFIGDLEYAPAWAHVVRPHPEADRMVAIGLTDDMSGEVRTGIAKGDTPPEAAVRATLQALNRTIAARLPVLVAD